MEGRSQTDPTTLLSVPSSCPALKPGLSSYELLFRLTDPCRYDRFSRPEHDGQPLPIYTRMFVYYLGSVEAHTLVTASPQKWWSTS